MKWASLHSPPSGSLLKLFHIQSPIWGVLFSPNLSQFQQWFKTSVDTELVSNPGERGIPAINYPW